MIDSLSDLDAKLPSVLIKEAAGETLTAEEEEVLAAEYAACAGSFLRFLGYCYIEEPTVPGDTSSGGVIRLELWPHLLDIIDALANNRLIIILKSRQIGMSTVTAAFATWMFLFHPHSNILIIATKLATAKIFIRKVKTMIKHLSP